MAFDSNGNWSSDFYPITDRDNNVPILASKFQTLIQSNLKQSFENCILRDGTGKPTSSISWNGQKITNLANGTNSTDAVNKSQLDSAVAVAATEEQQGTVELSTQAEALAGTDDTTAMTPAKVKAVFDTLTTSTRFCANSGHVASNGTPSILSRTQTTTATFSNVSESYPLVCTTAAGTSFTITSISSIDISGYANGTYNIFVDSNSVAYLYPNTIYRKASQPASMNTNDIWLDTKEPFKSYIKTGTGLVETGLVPLPERIVISSGAITSVEVLGYYNDNFVYNDIVSTYENLTSAQAPFTVPVSISWNTEYTAPSNGFVIFVYNGSTNWDARISISPGFDFQVPAKYAGVLPVFKGQTIKLTGTTPSADAFHCHFHRSIGFSGITL